MIIGIDDTGNFENEVSFFCSVLVRPTQLTEFEKIFIQWERNTRKELGLTGEIKGASLPPESLYDFADKVIRNDISKWVLCVGSIGAQEESVTRYCEMQKKVALEGLERGIEFYLKRDSGKSKIANQYRNLVDWYKRLNNQNLLKITVLSECIAKSIKWGVIKAAVDEYDEELSEMRLFIDESFISRQRDTLLNWEDLMRSILWQISYKDPLVIPTEWGNDHPFIEKFIQQSQGQKVLLKPALRQSIDFYKSHQNPIIRIADITGVLIRKRELSHMNAEAYGIVREYLADKRITLLSLTTERSGIPSPYAPLDL
jgi:hypothetical protein